METETKMPEVLEDHRKCIKEDDPVIYTDGYCLYAHCDRCGCLYSRLRNKKEWSQLDNGRICFKDIQ